MANGWATRSNHRHAVNIQEVVQIIQSGRLLVVASPPLAGATQERSVMQRLAFDDVPDTITIVQVEVQ